MLSNLFVWVASELPYYTANSVPFFGKTGCGQVYLFVFTGYNAYKIWEYIVLRSKSKRRKVSARVKTIHQRLAATGYVHNYYTTSWKSTLSGH